MKQSITLELMDESAWYCTSSLVASGVNCTLKSAKLSPPRMHWSLIMTLCMNSIAAQSFTCSNTGHNSTIWHGWETVATTLVYGVVKLLTASSVCMTSGWFSMTLASPYFCRVNFTLWIISPNLPVSKATYLNFKFNLISESQVCNVEIIYLQS